MPKKTKAQLEADGSKLARGRVDGPAPSAPASRTPPGHLRAGGKALWCLVAEWLGKHDRLSETDLPALQMICETWDEIEIAKIDITKSGRDRLDSHGRECERPVVRRAERLRLNFLALAKDYGLTPKAREAMGFSLPGDPNELRGTDPLAAFKRK